MTLEGGVLTGARSRCTHMYQGGYAHQRLAAVRDWGEQNARGFARWMKHLTPSVLTALQWGWGHPFRVGLARAHSVALGDGVAGMLRALLLAIRHLARGAFSTLDWGWAHVRRLPQARVRVAALGDGVAGMLRALLLRTRHFGSSALTLVQARRPRDDRSPRLSRAHPGPHHHECPECLTTWQHDESCTAPLRMAVEDCPGCHAQEVRLTDRAVDPTAALGQSMWNRPIRSGWVVQRRFIAAGLIALASGALLVLIASVFSNRTTVIPDLMLNMAARAPSDGGTRVVPAARPAASPDDHREASRIMVGSAKPSGRVPPAGEERTLGTQNASVQTRDTPPATPNPLVEVVAIRYGVIERTPLEWTWSWRVTVHKSGKTARVNVRIEFIEFQGSTRRIVGYEELCGLQLTDGRLVSIDGVHTLNAADSQRISAMTATISDATRCRHAGSGSGARANRHHPEPVNRNETAGWT